MKSLHVMNIKTGVDISNEGPWLLGVSLLGNSARYFRRARGWAGHLTALRRMVLSNALRQVICWLKPALPFYAITIYKIVIA
jgi:hypothetical protein